MLESWLKNQTCLRLHFCLSSTGGLFLSEELSLLRLTLILRVRCHKSILSWYFCPTYHDFHLERLILSCLRNTDHLFPISTRSGILILQSTTVSRLGFENSSLWINLTYGVTGGAPVIQAWTAYTEREIPNSNWIFPWHCLSLCRAPFETTSWYTWTGLSTIHSSFISES